MARTPVLQRRTFFNYVNRYSTVRQDFPWNVVDTELGPMVEPRMLPLIIDGKIVQIDAVDAAIDSESFLDPTTFYSTYGTDGQQLLYDYNY